MAILCFVFAVWVVEGDGDVLSRAKRTTGSARRIHQLSARCGPDFPVRHDGFGRLMTAATASRHGGRVQSAQCMVIAEPRRSMRDESVQQCMNVQNEEHTVAPEHYFAERRELL